MSQNRITMRFYRRREPELVAIHMFLGDKFPEYVKACLKKYYLGEKNEIPVIKCSGNISQMPVYSVIQLQLNERNKKDMELKKHLNGIVPGIKNSLVKHIIYMCIGDKMRVTHDRKTSKIYIDSK